MGSEMCIRDSAKSLLDEGQMSVFLKSVNSDSMSNLMSNEMDEHDYFRDYRDGSFSVSDHDIYDEEPDGKFDIEIIIQKERLRKKELTAKKLDLKQSEIELKRDLSHLICDHNDYDVETTLKNYKRYQQENEV